MADVVHQDLPVFHGTPEAIKEVQSKVLPYLGMVLSKEEYDSASRWLEDLLVDERLQEYEPVLVHGDPFHGNILVNEEASTVTGVVDFENSTLGDPAQDLAVQYHMGSTFAQAVFDAYQEIGDGFSESFEHRIRQLWILREFGG